jgi:hypothetical protein
VSQPNAWTLFVKAFVVAAIYLKREFYRLAEWTGLGQMGTLLITASLAGAIAAVFTSMRGYGQFGIVLLSMILSFAIIASLLTYIIPLKTLETTEKQYATKHVELLRLREEYAGIRARLRSERQAARQRALQKQAEEDARRKADEELARQQAVQEAARQRALQEQAGEDTRRSADEELARQRTADDAAVPDRRTVAARVTAGIRPVSNEPIVSVAAILAGVTVGFGGAFAVSVGLGIALLAKGMSQQEITAYVEQFRIGIPRLIIDIAAPLLGGFIAGRVAKRFEVLHGGIIGVIGCLIGVFLFYDATFPLWYNVAFFAGQSSGLLGGCLAKLGGYALPAPIGDFGGAPKEHPIVLPHQDRRQVVVVAPTKSVGISIILTFLFGPLGMLYSTVAGGLFMMLVSLAVGICTFGVGLLVTWPICILWGALAASSYNAKLTRGIRQY